jgi:ADP-heptose:LPS heptosyltransferase
MTDQSVIPILVEGGLGDNAIALPYLDGLREAVGQDRTYRLYSRHPEIIELLLPWSGKVLSYANYLSDLKDFDWALTVTEFVLFTVNKIQATMPPAMIAIFKEWLFHYKDYGHFFDEFPRTAFILERLITNAGFNRYNFCFHQTGLPVREFKIKCDRPALAPEKYIVINDGFAAHHACLRATKCWDLLFWDETLKKLKNAYPNYAIVQLGDKRSIPIRNVDVCLLGKTDLEDMIRWLTHADLMIGNDSGPSHVRAWSKKPSIILFGPTPARYFGYPHNINLEGNLCFDCWWSMGDDLDWNSYCRFRFKDCIRMRSITPDQVFDAASHLLLD